MKTVSALAETELYCNVSDAGLQTGSGDAIADFDPPRGQARREAGIAFQSNFNHLVTKLSQEVTSTYGKVKRLAIHAHGLPGKIHPEGGLSAATIQQFDSALALLESSLTEDAVVVFVGCLAGQGAEGDQLLLEVFSPLASAAGSGN